MQKMLKILLYAFIIFCMNFVSVSAQNYDIKIHNRSEDLPNAMSTNIDAGPATGNILNIHYFPGLIDFQRGNYRVAKSQMDYFLERPQYSQMNPRQREFFSHGHYIRGMIYLYHASGYGRFALAKKDFEQSIRWNPKNYASYLQLSRVMSAVGLKDKAKNILQDLLKINSDYRIEKLIKEEITKIN